MSRVYVMTAGLILLFLGVQFYLVRAYVLTPSASQFVNQRFEEPNASAGFGQPAGYSGYRPFEQANVSQSAYATSPFSQSIFGPTTNGQPRYTAASYSGIPGGQRSLAPPKWLCWPVLFFGAVVFLHGVALRRSE